jgi:hypothetical protein
VLFLDEFTEFRRDAIESLPAEKPLVTRGVKWPLSRGSIPPFGLRRSLEFIGA